MAAPLFSSIKASDLFSKFKPESRFWKILNFPLLRIIVIALFLVPIMALNAVVVFSIIEQVEEPLATHIDIVRMIITIPLLLMSYGLYCRFFEKRKAFEISLKGAWKEWLVGALVAASLVTLFVALISVFGSFEILEYRPALILLKNALAFSMGALLQDLILLCVLFRLVEELAGTWVGIAVSLLVFGFAHIMNPNQTIGTVIFLVLSSILLIAPFILTRRIWVSWGFHAAWNFMQAGVFGMPNSGIQFPGWMITKVEGPVWLTGGAVGIEGSWLAFSADITLGLLVLYVAVRAGKIVVSSFEIFRQPPISG